MTLRDALAYAKLHGGYVVYGTPPCWTEYSVQHWWDGEILYWTAGMTTGGAADPNDEHRFARARNLTKFAVYRHWKDEEPIVA